MLQSRLKTLESPAQSRKLSLSQKIWRVCPPPLALALLVFALGWLVDLGRGPLIITFGDDSRFDQLYLSSGPGGFYQPEARITTDARGQTTKQTYRWAGRTSFIKLHWPTDAVPLKATVRLSAPRPGRSPDQGGTTLKVSGLLDWDKIDLGQFDLTGFYEGRDYVFKIPVHLRPNLGQFSLKFEASDLYPVEVSRDPRGLSVIFFTLKLEPDYSAFGWAGWLATLARPALLAIITFCMWALAKLIFQKRRVALIIEVASGLALLLSLVFWPIIAESYYAAWAFILPVAWLLAGLALLFARRAQHLPAPFVFAATLYPAIPLAQFAFGRLNLYTLNPSSVNIGIYLCALLFCAASFFSSQFSADPIASFERGFIRATLFAALACFLYTHFSLWQADIYRGSEFKFYYELLQAKSGLYLEKGLAEPVPPALRLLFAPLILLGANTDIALAIWRVFSELLFIVGLVLLVRLFGGERRGYNYTPALLFLALNFGAVAEIVGYGRYELVVLLTLILTAFWLKRGRAGLAGLALAGAVALKPFTLLVLPGLVFQKRGLRIKSSLALAIGILAVGLVLGLSGWLEVIPAYLARLFTNVPATISNQSGWAFLARLVLPQTGDASGESLPLWLLSLGLAGSLAAICLTFYKIRPYFGRQAFDMSCFLAYGALILLGLMVAPSVWMPLMVLAILPVGVLLNRLSLAQTGRWPLFAFALAYGLMAYGTRFDFFQDEAIGFAQVGSSYRFLACLMLWALCLLGLRAKEETLD